MQAEVVDAARERLRKAYSALMARKTLARVFTLQLPAIRADNYDSADKAKRPLQDIVLGDQDFSDCIQEMSGKSATTWLSFMGLSKASAWNPVERAFRSLARSYADEQDTVRAVATARMECILCEFLLRRRDFQAMFLSVDPRCRNAFESTGNCAVALRSFARALSGYGTSLGYAEAWGTPEDTSGLLMEMGVVQMTESTMSVVWSRLEEAATNYAVAQRRQRQAMPRVDGSAQAAGAREGVSGSKEGQAAANGQSDPRLVQFDEVEEELKSIVGNEELLETVWKALDQDSGGTIGLQELVGQCERMFPCLNNRKATFTAYRWTCEGSEAIEVRRVAHAPPTCVFWIDPLLFLAASRTAFLPSTTVAELNQRTRAPARLPHSAPPCPCTVLRVSSRLLHQTQDSGPRLKC
jgi:hypothetical protein